jgi:hypothetical protein
MRRNAGKSTFALRSLLLCALPVALAAQTSAQPAAQAGWVIRGIVRSASTGQPLDGATITLTNANNFQSVAETSSDEEGQFSFQGIPPGKFEVVASHHGYVRAAFNEHDGISTAIVTGDGMASDGLEFKLELQGVIAGTVTEDSGDPVPNARLSLYRHDKQRGTGRMVRATATTADPMGNYEFAQLPPGAYYLCASGMPWYAADRISRQDGSDGGGANQSRSPLDVAYPVTCYPGATDPNAAEPILVGAGYRIPANLTLHAVPAVHILVRIPTPEGNRGIPMPRLQEDIFGNSEFVTGAVSNVTQNADSTTTLELYGIAPGQYAVELRDPSAESTRHTTVSALTDHETLDLTTAVPSPEVSGKITLSGGGTLPSGLFVMLAPLEGEERGGAQVLADGTFHLKAVAPGNYEVIVSSQLGVAMGVTNLKSSAGNVSGHIVAVGREAVDLLVEVTEAQATVRGFAQQNGKPASGVFILLIPANPKAGRWAWQPNQSDSDGSFDFFRVSPGNYIVVAIQEGWTLDWARPEVISPYLAKGVRAHVSTSVKEINLTVPVQAQLK